MDGRRCRKNVRLGNSGKMRKPESSRQPRFDKHVIRSQVSLVVKLLEAVQGGERPFRAKPGRKKKKKKQERRYFETGLCEL